MGGGATAESRDCKLKIFLRRPLMFHEKTFEDTVAAEALSDHTSLNDCFEYEKHLGMAFWYV